MERSLCLAVSETPAAEPGKEARVEAALLPGGRDPWLLGRELQRFDYVLCSGYM